MRLVSIKLSALKQFSLCAIFLIAAPAHSACVVPDLAAPLEQQLSLLGDCQRNPAYLAQVGRLLIQNGRYLDALDHLERALMLDAEQPAVQLDYAIALAGTGDILSATLLIDGILAQPDLNPRVRDTLVRAKQRFVRTPTAVLAGAASQPFALNLSANLRYGHDSNLLGAPALSSIELTFPGEVVQLPLSPTNAPRPGHYLRTDFKLELGRQYEDGSRWELATNLMSRTSPAVPDANTRQAEVVLEYSQPQLNSWGRYVGANLVTITTDGGTRYTTQGLAAGLQLSALAAALRSTCSARLGVELHRSDLISNPILSGHYAGITGLLACSAPTGVQWQVSAKGGRDFAQDADRPGSTQNLNSLRGVAMVPTLAVAGTLLLETEYTRTQDSTSYSALLKNGEPRRTDRLTGRLEFQRQLSAKATGTLGVEWSSQDSNLSLFQVKSWGPYAALRLLW
ncbi:MAG: hypothetical protein CFE44_01665 [Burkholderiales bacterium PBB4]|nr:MAG: hypothetical protein CFE44_01665 [Burkholderiales bacterium PBB4]